MNCSLQNVCSYIMWSVILDWIEESEVCLNFNHWPESACHQWYGLSPEEICCVSSSNSLCAGSVVCLHLNISRQILLFCRKCAGHVSVFDRATQYAFNSLYFQSGLENMQCTGWQNDHTQIWIILQHSHTYFIWPFWFFGFWYWYLSRRFSWTTKQS